MTTISPKETDVLKEMSSIGSGHAATSLAQLIGKKVGITNPRISTVALDQVAENLGGSEQIVTTLLFKILGEVSGSIMMVFPKDTATQLLSLWFGEDSSLKTPLDPFHESALKELSNVATGAYLTALSQLTGQTFRTSIPLFATDMLGSLLDEILSDIALQSDTVILMDTEFMLEQQRLQGFILLLFSPQTLKKFKVIL